MKHLKYWLQTASQDCGEHGHPKAVMKELGITYQHATPQSMGDQWWFWNCENLPDELPEYISPLGTDPMKCIGWGLDQEIAEKIRDYKVKI